MSRGVCRELAELRSAYVDGALADGERERVVAHLLDCAECRAEVAELRQVRQLLSQVGRSTEEPAPGELSTRLVSIAGRDAYDPVWSRPFRRTRPGALPSQRRAVRVRVTAAAVAFGGLLSALGVIGYAAAPSARSVALGDPSDRVRAEFAATLAQLPLASQAVNALMMTSAADRAALTTSATAPRRPAVTRLRVTADAALAVLRRSASQSHDVSYRGTQRVLVNHDGQSLAATVQVSARARQGSVLQLYDESGRQLLNGSLPATASSTLADTDQLLLSLLPQSYTISGWAGSTVAGRAATLVQAASAREAEAGRPVARWWVDDATGLVLWQESYDASGHLALAAGFTSISVTDRPVFVPHLAPRLASSATTASLNPTSVHDLVSRGWACRDALAGLTLVRAGSDTSADHDAVHLLYSDGVSALSVFEERGTMSGAPAGSRWDSSLGAFVTPGTPTLVSWPSADRLFTVVSDGRADLVDRAVRSLPHVAPRSETTMERVRAGWVSIVERVVR